MFTEHSLVQAIRFTEEWNSSRTSISDIRYMLQALSRRLTRWLNTVLLYLLLYCWIYQKDISIVNLGNLVIIKTEPVA